MLILVLSSQGSAGINVGVSLGATLAVVCSWQRNRSIMWAILHGVLSWIYVVYFALTRTDSERKKPDQAHMSGRRRHGARKEGELSFRDFLEADPLANHLDSTEQMRRFIEWKNNHKK